ncbi:Aldehyde oxidoreductase [Salinivirga cyanobacteriivorans]|uniref:Aldehyde oxidoreductase n=1 Tax=Salinivirga cyanobacteriivorans TaxID=1307839 RepID=A0A0S2I286_9BACT|nr:selenium-dependent xanthine dehydrogenase [Salinivirga cyanobacteriivorans]ALO16343.1 Aldehyde oxidoreductase [Salinivirga cyanobacteriivorans]
MIRYTLNGVQTAYSGDESQSLLSHLRNDLNITTLKDGCSGQGTCGACTVEINGKARLACRTKMKSIENDEVNTIEGLPEQFKTVISKAFAERGSVQCGFCSPGMIMRAKSLYNTNTKPSRDEIFKAISPNICRCTGYVKIVDAIEEAFAILRDEQPKKYEKSATIGGRYPKYQSEETALGFRDFVDDMRFEGMLHGALKFSEHPRARVIKINTTKAEKLPGVERVFTAKDIPGEQFQGLIFQDWPLMIGENEITRYIGDVLAGVVAETDAIAREALGLINVEYEVLEAVTDMHEAAKPESPQVHEGRSNVLETCAINFGDVDKAFEEAAYTSTGIYETQRIEHAFLETETGIAKPENDGIRLYTQGQGAYVDRKLVAKILGIEEEKVIAVQVQNGGGFGGKEDLTVQGHVSMYAYLLQKPVKVHLTREESMRMHPKRHPVWMNIGLACDKNGKFTGVKLDAIGDTGAYASVGTKVMERVVGHATGGYTVPSVDIKAVTAYTNNIPCGAMRGFGVPQVIFAIESCIDDICKQGGFDRWQIRYDNALEDGAKTATGQKLQGVGLKKTLEAVKDEFQKARFAGIATGIKNTGVGNGMIDDSEVKIEIKAKDHIVVNHGWTEMGQGVHTMAIQTLHSETGINPEHIEVKVETDAGVPTGMTTSSRATALVANAIIDASKHITNDLKGSTMEALVGRTYKGKYVCDFTCAPGDDVEDPKIHFAYGYATQVVILDDNGKVDKVIAAHDAGKIMNRTLFEGQIEGAVHMGLGYALTEDFPLKDGYPLSYKYNDIGILRAKEMPKVDVIGIEEEDPIGPYGAKGIGEIGLCPTAGAVANALYTFDGIRRTKLPMQRKKS